MRVSDRLLEILACPEDKGPLYYFADEDALYNPRLHRRYDVRDGIPVMLIDEATTLNDAEHARLMARVAAEHIAPTRLLLSPERGLSRLVPAGPSPTRSFLDRP